MMAVMMSLMIPRAATSAERIQEVLMTESSVIDTTSPRRVTPRTGLVEFRGVTFKYPGAEHPVLEDISFVAHPGTVTAVVGSTGSGKTTLLNLIPRFIDVSEGEVLLDGVNVKDQGLEDLWSNIALVPQRAFLFGTSIANNLRYGKLDASDAELHHALKVAQAEEFVATLPEQLETLVAQGGTSLSGGQRQRISIARALVKRAPVLLLDDSFSALDFTTDSKLRAALLAEEGAATMIVVAQRVSSIMNADQIVVLDEGRAVGIGSHKELMRTCATYKEIVLSQLSAQEAS